MPLSPLSYGALSFNPFIIFMHCLLISIMFVAKCETLKDEINGYIKYPGWNCRDTTETILES